MTLTDDTNLASNDAMDTPVQTGSGYWRSLEELADSSEFRESIASEFPEYDPEQIKGMSRRNFLALAGASMALAGLTLTGCRRWPKEQLAPYAVRPAGRVPGTTQQYATCLKHQGTAIGALVTCFDGRPIKVEGMPDHPDSLGAANLFMQASILDLYDPDRGTGVVHQGTAGRTRSSWANFEKFAHDTLPTLDPSRIAVLTDLDDSPTRQQLLKQFGEQYPGSQVYRWSPVNHDNASQGLATAFGATSPWRPLYNLAKASTIACFDDDLLVEHPASLKYARQWADGRRQADKDGTMNRLWAFEPSMTHTGSVADERVPVKASLVPDLLTGLAHLLGIDTGELRMPAAVAGYADQLTALARDLAESYGKALVTVGPRQSPECHALVAAINAKLGPRSNTSGPVIYFLDPAARTTTATQDIAALTEALNNGQVDLLISVGGNPAYDAPANLDFAKAIGKAKHSVHLSMYADETSQACDWHLPMAHPFEAWGDGYSWAGTHSIQQPIILPLFEGKSDIEVLSMLTTGKVQPGYDLVRDTYRSRGAHYEGMFERAWRQVVHDGRISGTGRVVGGPIRETVMPQSSAADDDFEVTFAPSRQVFDGRFANNGWLQETPEPMTKVTWDNPALINIHDARKLGLTTGDMITVTVDGQSLDVPVYLMAGQARGSISLFLGYGRSISGNVGTEVGFNTYPLRSSATPGIATAAIKPTGEHYKLAMTINHHLIDDIGRWAREKRVGKLGKSGYVIRETSLKKYKADKNIIHRDDHGNMDKPLQLWEPPSEFNEPHAWGMTIDMSACIGCNACVTACQSENNIPVAGKDQVAMSREMHWLRIDRYFKTDRKADPHSEHPEVIHQPMMCVHCENAPCEQVCPVAATVHDTEGLNTMVYNRCIGTRYCSNNCPYKVRRFNYFDYHAKDPRGSAKPWLDMPDTQQQAAIGPVKRMVMNPQVTVRMRGVMEKCTYCTQRIADARISARNEHAKGNRDIPTVKDGEVVTACQQTCPTQAITFGNLNDKTAKVTAKQKNPRAYGVLAQLNVRPRTKYLAKVRNPAMENKTGNYEDTKGPSH